MSIENLKITAILKSPLVGDPPYLDALLTYELGFKMNSFSSRKFNKATPIEEFKRLPIPLTQYEINGVKVNNCSDPIFIIKTEWHDKLSKRFETDKLSLLIDPTKRKNIVPGSGHLRSRYNPLHAKLIDRVVWFARGDGKECERILKGIMSLGHFRKIGYGLIAKWRIEELQGKFDCIITNFSGKKFLLKTVPFGDDLKYTEGYRKSYGSVIPPYWHPGNFQDIAVPL
jgi:hypothetical protein